MKGKEGFYNKYIKRILDIVCALLAMVVFCWLYAIIAILVRVKLGSPVVFKQVRPGRIDPKTGKEKLFTLYKFRSMTDARDKDGNLLSDEKRLTRFGCYLRALSLDEIPEAWNILRGDMSVVGPRPQLVRDMVFMTAEQRQRHCVRPGLSGLAQIRGRNTLDWEKKLETDLEYIMNLSAVLDIRIVIETIKQVFFNKKIFEKGMEDEMAQNDDFGDYLLKKGSISLEDWNSLQAEARLLINNR